MKIIFLSSFFIFILSGCSDDISSFSKEECTELGYTYTNEKRLNYQIASLILLKIFLILLFIVNII